MKKSGPPKDTGTQVDVLIKQANALAKAKPVKWRDFNRFVADVDRLVEFYKELFEMASGDIEDNAEWCQELAAKCKAAFERFDRRENYDDPDDDESELSQAYIAKRITVMVASFPNANPSSPEGYMQMLVEHVAAVEDLIEVALESACREIVETQKFAPAISEVLQVINKHTDLWWSRRHVVRNVELRRREALEAVVKLEQQKEKQEHQRQVMNATYEVKCAIAKTQRLAKMIEEAKAALAEIVEQHAKDLAERVQRHAFVMAKTKDQYAETEKAGEQAIANLIDQHAEAEKRESELNRKLRALTATEEEHEAQAAAKANGAGCAELRLMPPRAPCLEAKSEREHLSGRMPGD
jgi:hypothetical protein